MAEKEYHVGKLIYGLRRERKFTMDKVCYGLCSKGMMSKIESGSIVPSKLMTDALFQRLGTSIDQYGTIYTAGEYEFYEKQNELLDLLKKGERKEAEKKLRKMEAMGTTGSVLQQRFFKQVEWYLLRENGTTLPNQEISLLAVLRMTIPGFSLTDLEEYLYDETELSLLAFYADLLWEEGKKNEGIRLYQFLIRYVEQDVVDEEEKVRLYPKLVLLLAEKLEQDGRFGELGICTEAIRRLRSSHKLYCLEGLLRCKLAGWEKGGIPVPEGENELAVRAAISALVNLSKEYPVARELSFSWKTESGGRGTMVGYRFFSLRSHLGYTQERVCDGICEPETVSRIERNQVAPSKRNYYGLMKKLGGETDRYLPFLKSNQFRLHKARREMVLLLEQKKYAEAEKKLEVLERELNQGEPLNRQVLLRYRAILDYRLKRSSKIEVMDRMTRAVHLTMPKNCDLTKWPLTQAENVIWNNIANLKFDKNEKDEAIGILTDLKRSYENNPVDIKDNVTGYLMTLYNLTVYLGLTGRHEEEKKNCEDGIYYSLYSGKAYILVDFLYAKIWNMEQMDEKGQLHLEDREKTCLPKLKQAFSIAEIIRYEHMQKHIEMHSRYCFQQSIQNFL